MTNVPASTPRYLPGHLTQSSRQLAAPQGTLVPVWSTRSANCLSEAQYQDRIQSIASRPGNKTAGAMISGIKAARGKPVSHGSGSPGKKKRDRSVSALTPTQLQRKRAKDRMYQKVARQRVRDRINSLAEEVRGFKELQSNDNEAIRDLRRRNQALKEEVEVQKRLRMSDRETICRIRIRNQALEAETASLFAGFGTPWVGAKIGTASPAATFDGPPGL
ncbi:hypothetical protein Purlil1_13696 [Purpureocillium lilacinum]|uniref:BZIP domain-containing protein n=1 Tax=Purpureocillium lilacinum TaxID=33203 RepID=A0ABR0BE03_PURLI|nr:hypothetical protein Purlil1_13696 [Purpureocillium lilacinum]